MRKTTITDIAVMGDELQGMTPVAAWVERARLCGADYRSHVVIDPQTMIVESLDRKIYRLVKRTSADGSYSWYRLVL